MTCTSRDPTPCKLSAPTREELLDSWDNQHFLSDDTVWMFKRGHPYGSVDDDDREDIYYARVKRDLDVQFQLASLLPLAGWLTWKQVGEIVKTEWGGYDMKLHARIQDEVETVLMSR